jgi:hypothetical protein
MLKPLTTPATSRPTLLLLWARRKVLTVAHQAEGFTAVILDRSEYEALVAGRRQFAGKRLAEAMVRARGAVEVGGP